MVFPDVEVGDSVGLAYRIVETEPMFPGHFSLAEWIALVIWLALGLLLRQRA